MAKTTKEFLDNAAQTAAGLNPGRAAEAIPATPPKNVIEVAVPDPNNPDVGGAHDPANPGVPPWELNRAASNPA